MLVVKPQCNAASIDNELKELLENHNVKQIANVRLGAEGEIKPKRWKCTKGNKKNGKLRLPSYSYIVPTYIQSTSVQYFPSVRAVGCVAGLR